MTESHVISQLKERASKLRAAIDAYEDKVKEAQRDLAHLNAAIRLFEIGDMPLQFPVHMDSRQLFKPRQLGQLAMQGLERNGAMTTRELAIYVITERGLDATDKVLRQSVGYRLVQSLTRQWKRGKLGSEGVRGGVRVWRVCSPNLAIFV